MSEVVAVIPARGGSKGVPRKNLRRVGGIPLIARAISAASGSRLVDRVVVSTDDAEIAAIAEEWSAHVILRPASLADDTASSESVLLHALDALRHEGVDAGVLAFLQATSPFIDGAGLDAAIRLVQAGTHDSVFSAMETYGFLWRVDSESRASGINHDSRVRPRRQDREPHHLETGAFYVMDAAGFLAAGHRFFGRVGLVEVSEQTAIEIDSEEQLRLAQAIAIEVDGHTRAREPMDVGALVTDFDGVHTDDTALVDAGGSEFVRVSRSDGMGLARVRRAGIPVLILSTETNPVVSARARKLQVDVRQGVDDKAAVLREWAAQQDVPLTRVAYLGNDINDLACLDIVGWPAAVPDAHPLVLDAARIVVDRPGGHGAVRDISDRIVADRDRIVNARRLAAHTEGHSS